MVAEQNVRELENSAVQLSITVPKDELTAEYTKVVQKYVKSVQIPGFRKGKVPTSILEQKIGSGMREESVYNVIEAAVKEALEHVEDKYRPLPYSTPALVEEESIAKDLAEDLKFAVSYDIMPMFELPAYTQLTVEAPKVVVSEADLTKEIDRLREQNALVVDKSAPVAEGDIVTIDYVELDADGKEVEQTDRKDFVFTVGSKINFYQIDEDVIGMSKDEVKTVTKTYPDDFEHAEYAGKTITLKITLKQVQIREVPELDDDFAQDVSEQYKNVEDLQKATREKLEESLQHHLDEVRLGKIMDAILANVTITVPASMIEVEVDASWRRFVSQSGLPEAQLLKYLEFQGQTKADFTAQWKEGAEHNIKTQLVMDKIKEKESFEIDQAEVDAIVEKELKDVTDPDTRAYYVHMIEDDMKFKKVNEFLLANNTVDETSEVSYEDFMAQHRH